MKLSKWHKHKIQQKWDTDMYYVWLQDGTIIDAKMERWLLRRYEPWVWVCGSPLPYEK
jgi:hypothetical protein